MDEHTVFLVMRSVFCMLCRAILVFKRVEYLKWLFFAKEKVLLLDYYGNLNDNSVSLIQAPKVVPLILRSVFPCITSTITVDNQQDATILIYLLQSDLHVSGGVFAHHQKHISVTTAFGNVHRCCVRNTSQQQHRRTLPEAVVTVICY